MGLFDKLKKKAQEQMESSGISEILEDQKAALRYGMKNGGYTLLRSDAAEKIAAFRAQEEAEKKAKEEAERKAKEEAERRAEEAAERKEAARLAREAAECKARAEANRLAKEAIEIKEAERRAQEAAECKAQKEAERRVEAERKAKEEMERQIKKALFDAKDIHDKAENGDAQAACQLAMWFQYGQKGFPRNKEQAKYWYQQAVVLGSANAMNFLTMMIEEEKQQGINVGQKEEECKMQEAENRKRLEYDSEDEFLACEKGDGEAAWRHAMEIADTLESYNSDNINQIQQGLDKAEECIKYFRMAENNYPHGEAVQDASYNLRHIAMQIRMAEALKKNFRLLIGATVRKQQDSERRRIHEQEKKAKEESMVEVHFDYIGRKKDSSYHQSCHAYRKMPKEEYYALIQAGMPFLESYVKKNFENYFDYCTDVSISTR